MLSGSEEDTYSMIFASLRHPIRRGILRILSDNPQAFSDLQRMFKIESSHLTYHLEGLGSLLVKTEDGKYTLSALGEAAVSMMKHIEEPPTISPKSNLSSTRPHLWHSFSSNKKPSKGLLIIGIVLFASSFCCFHFVGRISYDYVTTYYDVVDFDPTPFLDPYTNISMQLAWVQLTPNIIMQPQDFLTTRVEKPPANGTIRLMLDAYHYTDSNWSFPYICHSENGVIDFKNDLPTEAYVQVCLNSEIPVSKIRTTTTLHHSETAQNWLFFGVGVVLASSGLVSVFKSKR